VGLTVHAASRIDLSRNYYPELSDSEEEGPTEGNKFYLAADGDYRLHEDGLPFGIFRYTGECQQFRVGPYSSFDDFKGLLIQMTGRTAYELCAALDAKHRPTESSFPFGGLICSACPGAIGPKTSARLAKDFADWEPSAVAFAATLPEGERDWFLEMYREWKLAVELAADGGAVVLS
jgi:hypothetical protein